MDRRHKPVSLKGQHGYDPSDPDMRAIFIAAGPRITKGSATSVHPNTDVYDVLTSLLGLPEDENRDGGNGLALAVLND